MNEFHDLGTVWITYLRDQNKIMHDVSRLFLGQCMKFGGVSWIVADTKPVNNKTAVQITLVSRNTLANVPFAIDDIGVDADSNIAIEHITDMPLLYANSIPAKWCNKIEPALERILNGRIEKIIDPETNAWVHLPTKEQLEGEWEYFSDAASRKCTDLAGYPSGYWTSSALSSGDVWFVYSDGGLSNYDPSVTFGFRPSFTITVDTRCKV